MSTRIIRKKYAITEDEADVLYACLAEAPELPDDFDLKSWDVQSLIDRELIEFSLRGDAAIEWYETTALGRAFLLAFRAEQFSQLEEDELLHSRDF